MNRPGGAHEEAGPRSRMREHRREVSLHTNRRHRPPCAGKATHGQQQGYVRGFLETQRDRWALCREHVPQPHGSGDPVERPDPMKHDVR